MSFGFSRKWSIPRILWLCFIPLIVFLVLIALVSNCQIGKTDRSLSQIVDVQNPLETAVLEIQIAANDISQSISEYIVYRDPTNIDKAQQSEDSIRSLSSKYNNLASTDDEKQIGEEIISYYEEFKGSYYHIVGLADDQYTAIEMFRENVNEINSLIDETLQVTLEIASPEAEKKLESMLNMKQSLETVLTSVESYIRVQDLTQQQEVLDAQASFVQSVATYRQTTMSDYEEKWLTLMDESLEETAIDATGIFTITDNLNDSVEEFNNAIEDTISYLEFTAQPFHQAQVASAVDDAQGSVSTSNSLIYTLLALGIIIAGISVIVISRMIVNPIRELTDGAETVDSGKLDHRFSIDAKGEFGQLSVALNRMLANLQRSKVVLGESEETAWQILDSTTDSVILTDRRGLILASNEIAAERYDKSLEQMVDTNFYDLLPSDLMASRKAQITEVIRTGKPLHFEDERNGMILDHRIYPVFGARGEVTRIAIFARDVTVHKWVEDVTDQLGRRNELILEAAGEGIYGLDIEGKTTFVNPAAARMLGYKPEDLIGQHHHELVHHSKPDGRVYPQSQCPIYAAFQDGTVHTSVDNEVFWRKDGTSFAVEYTSTPIVDKGNIVGAVVTFRDITERKRMESFLLTSEERYRSVFENAANLIISVDREGIIIDSNGRSQEILGYTPKQIIGKQLVDLIHSDDREKAQVSLDEAYNKGFDYHKRYRMIRKDSISIDVQMNSATARNSKGVYIRTICMIDTT